MHRQVSTCPSVSLGYCKKNQNREGQVLISFHEEGQENMNTQGKLTVSLLILFLPSLQSPEFHITQQLEVGE